jgi:23S rRNA pseudouridine2605 synthase
MGPQPVDEKNTRSGYWIEMVMGEGKKREIREMMDALGFKVLELVRIEHGPIVATTLRTGEIRELDDREKKALMGCIRA